MHRFVFGQIIFSITAVVPLSHMCAVRLFPLSYASAELANVITSVAGLERFIPPPPSTPTV